MRNDFVATGIVLNKGWSKMLLVYHLKLKKWVPPGGHMKLNELPHECAVREVFEETGVRAKVLDRTQHLFWQNGEETKLPTPYLVLYEVVPATEEEEEHRHVDFIYLMEAESTEVRVNLGEVEQARWMARDEIMHVDTYESVRQIGMMLLK
jgi:ADP-ribose pyrophosphatase YjhB (NUDIX family)